MTRTDAPGTDASTRSVLAGLRSRPGTGIVLRVAVTLGLLAYVGSTVDFGALARQFAVVDLSWVALALLFQLLGVAASSRAWQRLLAPFPGGGGGGGGGESYAALFRLYLTSRFLNLAGPGTVVGDASRAYGTRSDRGVAAPVAAVVAEKGLSVAAFVAVAAVAGTFVETPADAAVIAAIVGALLAAGVCAVLAARLLGLRSGSGSAPGPDTDPAPGARLVRAADGVLRAYADHPSAVGRAAVASLGVVAATVLSVWALAAALGVAVPFPYLWATVPLVAVAVALPVSIQGLGVREGAYVLLFGFVGVAPEAALAVGLANFAVSLAVAAIGGLVYLTHAGTAEAA